jgi:CD63 antigen
MECCSRFAQVILFVVNCIFFLFGIGLIVLGSVSIAKEKDFINDVGDVFKSTPITFIIVGSVTFFVATLGCCGAAKQNKCLLHAYAAFIAILLLLQVASIVLYFTHRQRIDDYTANRMLRAVKRYNTTEHYKKMLDSLQKQFQCCGSYGPLDYNGSIPNSCCIAQNCNTNINGQIYSQGCASVMVNFIKNNSAILIAILVIEILVQLMAILFACLIVRNENAGYKDFPK